MSRAKKQFKVGDVVEYTKLAGGLEGAVRQVQHASSRCIELSHNGRSVICNVLAPAEFKQIELYKPKKPKPARVWRADQWYVIDPDGIPRACYFSSDAKMLVKELNRLERKIRRLEGR